MSPQPTTVRWRIVGLLMALCFVSHMNRVSISIAADERLMKQFSISPEAMGTVYSAFLAVYTIFMTAGGWFIDRFGTRAALSVMGFGSAIFCALTGLVGFGFAIGGSVLATFIVIRSWMGLLTTPLHPGCARSVSQWTPFSQRSWANGLVTAAALLGIAGTYKIFGTLIDKFDWPTAFLITSATTIALTAIWICYATDTPAQHRSANQAERVLVQGGYMAAAATGGWGGDSKADPLTPPNPSAGIIEDSASIAPRSLLANRNLWLLTLSYAAVSYFQYLFFYWMHYYFDEVLHVGKETSRTYATIPPLAMAAGMALGGWFSDRVQQRFGPRWGRALVPLASMIGSAVLLGVGLFAKEPGWIVMWFSLALGVLGMCEGAFWTTIVEIGGRRGGTAAAILNTGGNGGGLLAPFFTPRVASAFGWQWGIALGGIICLFGAFLWCWIKPQKPSNENGHGASTC